MSSGGVTKRKSKGYLNKGMVGATKNSETRRKISNAGGFKDLGTFAYSKNAWAAFYNTDEGRLRLRKKRALVDAKIARYRKLLGDPLELQGKWKSGKQVYEDWVAANEILPNMGAGAPALQQLSVAIPRNRATPYNDAGRQLLNDGYTVEAQVSDYGTPVWFWTSSSGQDQFETPRVA